MERVNMAFILPYIIPRKEGRIDDNEIIVFINDESRKLKALGGHVEGYENAKVGMLREFAEEWDYPLDKKGAPLVTPKLFDTTKIYKADMQRQKCILASDLYYVSLHKAFDNVEQIKENIINHQLDARKACASVKYDIEGNLQNNGEPGQLTECESEVDNIMQVTLAELRNIAKHKSGITINGTKYKVSPVLSFMVNYFDENREDILNNGL